VARSATATTTQAAAAVQKQTSFQEARREETIKLNLKNRKREEGCRGWVISNGKAT